MDHPIHELVARRWSPYGFASRPVPPADLRSLFEAARWAASSFNEQPWRFLVAIREDEAAFARVLECLMEGNRTWAADAPALALGCVRTTFARDGRENSVARHDLGLAVGNLTLEATARGLFVHQMAGVLPERARDLFAIPAEFEMVTGIAIGYRAEAKDPNLRRRDEGPRTRRPLAEFVFGDRGGRAFPDPQRVACRAISVATASVRRFA